MDEGVMEAHVRLYQAVLHKALLDATSDAPLSVKLADVRYLLDDSADFRETCIRAGQSPEMVRDRFASGDICSDILRAAGDKRISAKTRGPLIHWLRRQRAPRTAREIARGCGWPIMRTRTAVVVALVNEGVRMAGHRDYVTLYEVP